MKLRLRCLESKETHKIEVPNSCNLQELKQAIILQLFPSSSSSSSALQQNLLLSLNRKEELSGSSPGVSIQSLGVTSGDLIYYTCNPRAFSSQTPYLPHPQSQISREITTNINIEEFVKLGDSQNVESSKLDELCGPSVEIRDVMEKTSNFINPSENLGVTQMMTESSNIDETRELMENSIDLVEGDDEMEVDEIHKFSVPTFLNKVFVNATDDGDDLKLLVLAVHTVLLESGFVGYDPVSGMKVEGFYISPECPSLAFGMTLHYTLPEVLTSEAVETVVLKFQTMGKFVNVYGSLPKKGFGVHRVCLNEPRFRLALRFIQKRSGDACAHTQMDDSNKLYPNQEIFEFWKIVKDGLSYPLLIDLCEQLGIVPPPCFMRLPTELKLKICESLPAVDVARVECVCSELRYIASNNDLWKLKYEEEFGNAALSLREIQWKAKFCSVWESRQKRKRYCRPLQFREPPLFRPLFPGRRDPNPLGSPFIIGGDYDRLPTFGLPQHPARRIFRRNCDLGGFGL